MQEWGIGSGLASLAFWGFIATAVVASYWDSIRKREAQHETLRRLIESGQDIDQATIDKLLSLTEGNSRPDRDMKITALWILPISPAIAVLGLILGSVYSQVLAPLLAVAGLLAIMGAGFWYGSHIAARWYTDEEELRDDS